MTKNKVFKFSLIVSFLLGSIPLIYTIFCIVNSYIVPIYLILSLAVSFALSLAVTFIKKIPNVVKAVLSVIILLLTLVIFAFLTLFGNTIEFRVFNNAEEINEYYEDFDFDKFGKYESISNYKYLSMAIFQQEAYTTFLKYDEENFEKEKNIIENDYEYYNKPVREEDDKPIFSCDGFDFKVEISNWYPKELHLIGTNEETLEIVHIYFRDYDLDSVEDFSRLLNYYCGWQYIMEERN